jgi:hypothetical protein
MTRTWLAAGVIIGALAFTVASLAGVDTYASGVSYSQGQTRASAYDSCPYPGLIYGSTFVKGSNDYGTTMFIDNDGYHWHKTVAGYGTLNTVESSYHYVKKAASYNSGTNGSYTGSGLATYYDAQCI